MNTQFQMHVEPKANHLYVTVSGPFQLEEARQLFDNILAAGIEYSRDRIVVDITRMTQYENNPLIERFGIASYIGDTQTPGTRLAFLFTPAQMLPDRFDENVAVNRGACLITTTDLAEAMTWLGLDKMSPPFRAAGT